MRVEIVRGVFVDGVAHAAGAVVELDGSVALALLNMGKARPAPAQPETAMMAEGETAVALRPAAARPAADVRAQTLVLVSEMPEISVAMAAALLDLGIETVEELAAVDVATLTRIKGVGQATARKWQTAAKRMVNG